MTKFEWSENQPPEWTEKPAPGPIPPATEPTPNSTGWSFGEVISRSWEQMTANIRVIGRVGITAFAVYSGLAVIGIVALGQWTEIDAEFVDAVMGGGTTESDPSKIDLNLLLTSGLTNLGFSLIATLIQFWLVAVIANQILGKTGASGWGRLLGANFLFAGLLILPLTALSVAFVLLLETAAVIAALLGLAILGLIVYAVYLSIGLIPLTGVVLNEDLGGMKSLRRALELGRGYRWRMFLPILIFTFFSALITGTLNVFAFLPFTPLVQLYVYTLGLGFAVVFAAALSAAVSIVVYQNQLQLPRK